MGGKQSIKDKNNLLNNSNQQKQREDLMMELYNTDDINNQQNIKKELISISNPIFINNNSAKICKLNVSIINDIKKQHIIETISKCNNTNYQFFRTIFFKFISSCPTQVTVYYNATVIKLSTNSYIVDSLNQSFKIFYDNPGECSQQPGFQVFTNYNLSNNTNIEMINNIPSESKDKQSFIIEFETMHDGQKWKSFQCQNIEDNQFTNGIDESKLVYVKTLIEINNAAQNVQHCQGMSDDAQCVICMDADRQVMFLPCGHKAVCQECHTDMKKRKQQCPLCRQDILNSVDIKNENG